MDLTNFKTFVDGIRALILYAIPIVGSLGLLAFFWGLAKFIINAGGDAKTHQEGRNLMVWGLVALFLMVSIWGIIRFLQGEFGFSGGLVLPLFRSR
jgi:hypothetical protein